MPALPALPPPALIAACATTPQVKVLLSARADPWDIQQAAATAELERLARKTGMGGRHKAYGFYIGDVALAATVDIDNPAGNTCQGPVTVHLTMRLTNRHIGVAKDIQSGSCHFARVVAHYRHHAEADEAVFQSYATKVAATLEDARASALLGSAGALNSPASILKAADAAIEPVLADMDVARILVRSDVDTPAELKELTEACDAGI